MKAATNRRLRSLHHYLGVFFAPAILFFAVSGAVQTFRLNEAPAAPAWLGWIASVHKNQTVPRPRPAAGGPAQRPGGGRPAPGPRRSALPLKIFVVVMSAGLALSALLGIALALATPARRRGAAIMLALGTLLPVVLLLA